MIEVLHFYIYSFTVIMSYCIAFNGNLFHLMFGTSMLCSSRWFIACAISSRPKLSNKISAWEDLLLRVAKYHKKPVHEHEHLAEFEV